MPVIKLTPHRRRRLRSMGRDATAFAVAPALIIAAGLVGDWPIGPTILIALAAGFAIEHTVLRTRRSITESQAASIAHADNLFTQTEFAMELRRMLEPRAILPASRDWAASPDFLAVVCEHVQELRPKTMVECGAGLSTLMSSYALERFGPEGASLLTLEHDGAWAEESRRRVVRHELERISTIAHAPLVTQDVAGEQRPWYDLTGVELPARIDLLCIDGPPNIGSDLARFPAGPILNERLATGAFIVLDDAARPSECRAVERWINELGWERVSRLTAAEKGVTVLRKP